MSFKLYGVPFLWWYWGVIECWCITPSLKLLRAAVVGWLFSPCPLLVSVSKALVHLLLAVYMYLKMNWPTSFKEAFCVVLSLMLFIQSLIILVVSILQIVWCVLFGIVSCSLSLRLESTSVSKAWVLDVLGWFGYLNHFILLCICHICCNFCIGILLIHIGLTICVRCLSSKEGAQSWGFDTYSKCTWFDSYVLFREINCEDIISVK